MSQDSRQFDYFERAKLTQLLQVRQGAVTAPPTPLAWLTLPPLTDLNLTVQESVTSTNRELWSHAQQPNWHGRVLIAGQQSAGRGQFGRQWQSNLGGLYLSLGLCLQLPLTEASRLTYGVPWGLATVLNQNDIPVLLKWPNDLLLLNRKLGGILIETRLNPTGHIHQAVIGVGLNYRNAVPVTGISLAAFEALQQESSPSALGQVTSSDTVTSAPPRIASTGPLKIPQVRSLEELADLTLAGIWQGLQYWLRSEQSLCELLPRYEDWLAFQDQLIDVAGNSGRVLGVTTEGALRVRFGASEHEFLPGSLSFYPVANAQQWRCDLSSSEERVLE